MFKNNKYSKTIMTNIVIPREGSIIPKLEVKHEIKPNVSNKNYENIRNIVQNNKKEIKNSEIKPIKNKLNIV